MKLVLECPHFLVIDDFLPAKAFHAVQRFVTSEARLEFVNRVERLDVWSLDDGHPLLSPAIAKELDRDALRTGDGPFYPYPSGSALDTVLAAVIDQHARLQPWIGKRGRAWRTVTARAFVYPLGTGLDWHDDGGRYSGAFSYYAHETWRPQWGGELLIAVGKKMNGEFVLPLPNRLVVLKGGVPHKIARVSSSAGSNHRASVSGFFAKDSIDVVSDGTLVTDL